MLNSKLISSLIVSALVVLSMFGVACAKHAADVTAAQARDDLQTQSSGTTVQSFTPVEGADLMSKLNAAQARGRSGQSPYWSAYTFDVRPGVAVDPNVRDFNGSIHTIGDSSVFVGTTAGGITVETRNLAIFLLRDPRGIRSRAWRFTTSNANVNTAAIPFTGWPARTTKRV